MQVIGQPIKAAGAFAADSLVTALSAPLAWMAAPPVRRFLLAVIFLDIPLQVGKHLNYQEEAARLGALGGYNVSITTIALVILYAAWFIELCVMRERWSPRPRLRWSRPLALYVAICAASMLVARNATLSAFEVFLFLQMLLLFIYLANNLKTRDDVRFVVAMLLIGLVLESLLMFALVHSGERFSWMGLRTRIDVSSRSDLVRVAGSVGGPNVAGAYLSMILALAAPLVLARIGRWNWWLAATAFVLGFAALLLTLSRGAWVAFAIAFIIVGVQIFGHTRTWRKMLVAALLLALTAALLQADIAARLSGDDQGAAVSRIPLMKLAFRIILDHPLLGVGANNYTTVIDRYATSEFRHEFLYTVHNRFLVIWAETGIFGLMAFTWFLVATIRTGWRCWKTKDRLLSPIALGLAAALIGHSFHLMVDPFRGRPATQLVWCSAALISAIAAILTQERKLRSAALRREVRRG